MAGDRSAAALPARVNLGRRTWLVTLIVALLMLWPLTIAGRPAYFHDSVAYQQIGGEAIRLIKHRVRAAVGPGQPPAAAAVDDSRPPKALRSLAYSLLGYVLGRPHHSMAALAVFQALAAGLVIAVFLCLFGRGSAGGAALAGAVLAFTTPAAFFSVLIMPDIFAGLLIGAIALLAVYRRRLSLGLRIVLVGIAAIGVAVHASHPPLALAVTLAALASLLLVNRRPTLQLAGDAGWVSAPLVLGLAVTMLTGLVGFGDASVAPVRFPLVLVRSIVEGPARLYLRDHCADRRYAVCEVMGNEYAHSVEAILWGEKGLVKRATPEQFDRIRAEEPEIVWRAMLAHPGLQARRYVLNIGRQLIAMRVVDVAFNAVITYDVRSGLQYKALDGVPEMTAPQRVVNAVVPIAVILAIVWLAIGWRTMDRSMRTLLIIVAIGIVANAVICAVFSGVAHRYEARVIWLLPLLALCAPLGNRRTERAPAVDRSAASQLTGARSTATAR